MLPRKMDRYKRATVAADAGREWREMEEQVLRLGRVIGVHADKLEEYKRLHADVWPGVEEMIRQSNIRNFTIFHRRFPDGKQYLFSYCEYTGDDLEADTARIAADPTTQRWWELTKPCHDPLPDRDEGEWWALMDEIVHQP